MSELSRTVLSLSVSGSLLFLAVLGVRCLTGNRLSQKWQYYLWLLVVARFLIPVTPSESLMGALWAASAPNAIDLAAMADTQPEPAGPSSLEPAFVNPALPEKETGQPVSPAPVDQWLWAPWLAGALLLAARKGYQSRRAMAVILSESAAVTDPVMQGRLRAVCGELGLRVGCELYENPRVPSPLVFGLRSPKVILPSAAVSPEDLRLILLHELTHFQHKDPLYQWIVQLTLCVHWFNPLAYCLFRRVSRARELACDEAVVHRLDGRGRRAYGNLLIRSLNHPGKAAGALLGSALHADAQAVKERLVAMNGIKEKTGNVPLSLLLSMTIALTGFLLGAYVPQGALAENTLPVIQPGELMTLEGRDIFSYTSGELSALWSAPGMWENASVGYLGYAGEDQSLGLFFHSGMGLGLMTSRECTDDERESLRALPLAETRFPVVSVSISDTGIAGPFGVEVGMTADTLKSLVPSFEEEAPEAPGDDRDTQYSIRYQDDAGNAYTMVAACLKDMVTQCVVTRDGAR